MSRAVFAASLAAAWIAFAPRVMAQASEAPSAEPSPSEASPEAPPAADAPGDPAYIAAGAPVIVELVEAVSSRTVKQGDMFPIRLASPIVHEGRVIVAAGALGEGQVVDAGRAGALGKPAKLVLAARYIEIDGAPVQLRGFRLGAAGRDNSNAILAASFVPYVGVLALFARGGEIDVPAGTLGQAKLVADLATAPASAPPPESPPADTPSTTPPAAPADAASQ